MADGPSASQPPFPFYSAAEKDGFAFPTVSQRWPVIVTNIIDDIHRTVDENAASSPTNSDVDGEQRRQGSAVIAKLEALKYDIQHGKPIAPLENLYIHTTAKNQDGTPLILEDTDTRAWNDAIRQVFPGATYYSASWLFAECYLYRRIFDIISAQPLFKGYDPFLRQKKSALKDSFDGIVSVGRELDASLGDPSLLRELLVLSLWGNATDLSMFAGLSSDEKKLMLSESVGETNIVSNHLDQIVAFIQNELDGKRVDFILDNAGVELFYDMMLADHLHQSGRASVTVFHCKSIPWFVSDTTPADFGWLLDGLEAPETLFAGAEMELRQNLSNMVQRWRTYLMRNQWVVTSSPFWSSWKAHRHLADVDSKNTDVSTLQLWRELATKSALLIFKGDLNYRKLVYDCKFPATTPFSESLGETFARACPPIVALRTNKSDPCVGISAAKEEELVKLAGGDSWRWSGKFAVAQFYRGFKMLV
ncbi:hypothetical protein HK405_002773 [Cladochytrium tenue]|nr:hypothetical protein HK405_002773 [Cladochytrium tenue]